MASPKRYRIEKLVRGVREIRSGDQTGVYVTLFNVETKKSNRWPNFLSDQHEADQIAALEQAGEGGEVLITWSAVKSGGKTYYNIETVEPIELPKRAATKVFPDPVPVPGPAPEPDIGIYNPLLLGTALSEAVNLVDAMLSADPRFKSLLKPTKTTGDLLVETTLEIATKFQKFLEGKHVSAIEADDSDLKKEPVDFETPDLPKIPSEGPV